MTKAVKFTFDNHFDQDGPLQARGQTRSRRTYSADEIDAICARAREDGRSASEVRAMQAVAAGVSEVAAGLIRAIEALDEELEAVRGEATQFAFTAARKLAEAALQAAPEAEVIDALRAAMHQAIGEPRIVVKAAPELLQHLGAKAVEIAQQEGFEGRIHFAAEPGLAGADCRIEWRGGGIERTTAAIENALSELVARRFPPARQRPLKEE